MLEVKITERSPSLKSTQGAQSLTFNMKVDPNLEELFHLINEKHSRTMNTSERIIIKWLGWLTYFLSMSRKDRLDYCRNEAVIADTTRQLTEDMNELGAQRTTINTR